MRGVDKWHFLPCKSARGTNPLGADFSEVRRHGEFSGIDGMESAFGGDTDLESTMQFACGIVNIRFAPRHDRPTFDGGLWKSFSIQFGKRRHDGGKRAQCSRNYPRAKWLRRICVPVGRR